MAGEAIRNKSAIASMPDCKKTPLIRGSVTDADIEYPTDPTDGVKKMFNKKSSTDLYSAMNNILKSANLPTGRMSLGHATQITNYGIIWEDMTSPFGFKSFAFDPTTNKSSLNSSRPTRHSTTTITRLC